jgi:hypothetical protein
VLWKPKLADTFTRGARPTLAGCSLSTDLLRAALGEVDWYEIATHFAADIDRDGIEADFREDRDDEATDE